MVPSCRPACVASRLEIERIELFRRLVLAFLCVGWAEIPCLLYFVHYLVLCCTVRAVSYQAQD